MDQKKPRTGGNRGGVIEQNTRREFNPTRAGRASAGSVSHDDASTALFCISPDLDYDDWLRVVTAAKAAELHEDEVRTWSAGGASFNEREFRATWNSVEVEGEIKPATLFYYAKQHGYRADPTAPRPPPPTPAELARRAAARKPKPAIPPDPDYHPAAVWARCQPATVHSYAAQRKGRLEGLRVVPAGDPLRGQGHNLDGWLVIPVWRHGVDDGAPVSLVFVAPVEEHDHLKAAGRRTKWNLYGAPMDGFFIVGEHMPGAVVYVVEGIASAWAAHRVTGHAAAVAFGVGNVRKVLHKLRERDTGARPVIVADTGKDEKAAALGHEFGVACVCLPGVWPSNSDIDDFARLHGDEAARELLESATVDPVDPATLTDTPPPASAPLPDLPDKFACGERTFSVRSSGVYFQPPKDAKGHEQPERRLCDELRVIAQTRDPAGLEWGRWLWWRDPDGQEHRLAVPLELLAGDGAEVLRELARRGLSIAGGRGTRELVIAYIQTAPVKTRARCVDRLGWIGGAYVLPDQVIGAADGGEEVVFQGRTVEVAHAVAGSVDDWRRTVAALALGNSRLVFTIAAALAGPLLHLVGVEGGGFHLRGRSSSGKSTAIFAGASVWGPPAFVRPWRATSNGLEGVALLHNDGTLPLDEMAECEPRHLVELVYMLANGRGKARASATGAARPSARWRCLFISTGETSLEAQAATVGRRIAAGQEVRLADIEADAGAGFGAFEHLHGQPSPAAFAVAVRDAAAQHYGAAGVAWLRWLVANRAAATEAGAAVVARFVADAVPAGASGQVVRVARRFGLVAAAGELATRAGVTDWPRGEAMHAAQSCFAAWLAGFGAGDREERAILEQVRAFFEMHGSSRFEDISSDHGQRVPNRAGFYHHPSGPDSVRTFMVLPGVFRNEVCGGLDFKTAVRVLLARGWLAPEDDRHVAQRRRTPGGPLTRLYVFTSKVWEAAEGEE